MNIQDRWVAWAMEIQSLAQAGLTYGKDPYDLERYQRLREIAAEMIAEKADISLEKAKTLFCNETGYQTPKVDTRAAVFAGDKLLLVREKNGLSYNIEASYTPYSDSGIVAIYFSCDHDNTDHCIELIEGELERLRNTPLSARRLSMAKKQFIAQLAISMESNEGYMLGAGKSFLAHREVDTMEEVYRKIQALTAEDLTDVASSVFSSPSRLIYK